MGGRGAVSTSGIPDRKRVKVTVTDEKPARGQALRAFVVAKIQSVLDYPRLTGQVYNQLHTVSTGKITGASGFYSPSEKKIVVDSRLSGARQREVVAHELGHALAVSPPSGFRSDIAAFTKAYAEYKITHPRASEKSFSANISNYAASARSEAFAEAFKDVIINGTNAKPESQLIMQCWKE